MIRYSAAEHKRFMETQHRRVSSAALLLETADGQLLVVKANYKTYWTSPGGIIDEKETPKQAALRETYEEVGLTIDPATVEFVAVVNRTGDISDTYQFIFKAPLLPDMIDEITLQASEIDEYALATRQQVLAGDRKYGKVIGHWAHGRTGYIEQTFEKGDYA